MELSVVFLVSVMLVSLLCEYVDASIGMGFGTTLTPLLLLLGYSVLDVVPAVLMGQIAGGVIAGLFHHKLKNVQLDLQSKDTRIIVMLTAFGIVGALFAVLFAVNIPQLYLKMYIGLMILLIGIVILVRRNKTYDVSWTGITIIALISAFNKGVSGGGYGPLVTGGQLINGRETKNSVGSTTIAEVFVCITAFISYILLKKNINWELAIAASIGSMIAGPFSAITVQKFEDKNLKTIIGGVVSFLGVLTLGKIVF